ncbi:MAG: TonB-dependent receptor, partial [Bacteroidota bacterium]
MKKIISLFTLLFSTFTLLAQINFTVKGKIVDQAGYLPAGNILALNPADSTLLKGDFFLDGAFVLTNLTQENILLQFTSLEFADLYVPVEYNGQAVIDLGQLNTTQTGTALEEVVVKGRRSLFTQKKDGTIAVLVQNTALAANNSVTEILSKAPDILTNEDGGIEVFGKGNAIIFLNGKRIMNNQLGLIAPANIHKIDIIRNPSAQYDADGAAVIHIQTIQNAQNGYQTNLLQNVSHGDFWGTDTYSSVNTNFKKDQFSINGLFALRQGDDRHVQNTTRDRAPVDGFFSSDITNDWQHQLENFSQYGLGIQYDWKEQNYLSLEYAGASEKLGGRVTSTNTIITDDGRIDYESITNKNERAVDNSLSLNYHQTLDNNGGHLFIGGQHADFQTNTNDLISEASTTEEGDAFRNLKSQYDLNVKISSGQADFTKVYANDNQLSLGTKFSTIQNISGLDFLIVHREDNFTKDPNLSNNFTYREDVSAGYINFAGSTDRFNYSLGLRAEHTNYALDLIQVDRKKIKDRYLHFFPNFSITQQVSDDFTWNFAYTSSIARPPYERLNPAPIYQDPYTSIQGNPFLKPARTHALELNGQYKALTFKMGYDHTLDILGGAAIQGETDKSYILIRLNHDIAHALFSSLSTTFSNDWWTSTTTASLRYTKIIDRTLDFE